MSSNPISERDATLRAKVAVVTGAARLVTGATYDVTGGDSAHNAA